MVAFSLDRWHPGLGALRVNTASRAELLARVEASLASGEGFAVATLNLDHLVKLRRDRAFAEAYLVQRFVVADGNPVVWLSRLANTPVELAPGSELIDPIAAIAARRGVPVALFGSSEETLRAASETLRARHPGLRVAASVAPPQGFDPTGAAADASLDSLHRAGARVCFLALGAPKQEILAARGMARCPGCGFVSIGAGLDFIAGSQRRAPRWVRRLALEWLWRMAREPRRLAARYAACALILPGLAAAALRARLATRS